MARADLKGQGGAVDRWLATNVAYRSGYGFGYANVTQAARCLPRNRSSADSQKKEKR
ncbi:hypothetical protein [Phaeobacter inhibens]|uniref:hypothetical protein n=1 Tax=Phaeobacter inhibens TaxID=221822 RepID=UPI001313FAD9|nr:hypothetical protein [Phaeobacter inhibens]